MSHATIQNTKSFNTKSTWYCLDSKPRNKTYSPACYIQSTTAVENVCCNHTVTSSKNEPRCQNNEFGPLGISHHGRGRGSHWQGWEGRPKWGTSSKQRAERWASYQLWTGFRSKPSVKSIYKRLSVDVIVHPTYSVHTRVNTTSAAVYQNRRT